MLIAQKQSAIFSSNSTTHILLHDCQKLGVVVAETFLTRVFLKVHSTLRQIHVVGALYHVVN